MLWIDVPEAPSLYANHKSIIKDVLPIWRRFVRLDQLILTAGVAVDIHRRVTRIYGPTSLRIAETA
jgi:hypothetical protein